MGGCLFSVRKVTVGCAKKLLRGEFAETMSRKADRSLSGVHTARLRRGPFIKRLMDRVGPGGEKNPLSREEKGGGKPHERALTLLLRSRQSRKLKSAYETQRAYGSKKAKRGACVHPRGNQSAILR